MGVHRWSGAKTQLHSSNLSSSFPFCCAQSRLRRCQPNFVVAVCVLCTQSVGHFSLKITEKLKILLNRASLILLSFKLFQFKCCGSTNTDDWDWNPYYSCGATTIQSCGVPWSCCMRKVSFKSTIIKSPVIE